MAKTADLVNGFICSRSCAYVYVSMLTFQFGLTQTAWNAATSSENWKRERLANVFLLLLLLKWIVWIYIDAWVCVYLGLCQSTQIFLSLFDVHIFENFGIRACVWVCVCRAFWCIRFGVSVMNWEFALLESFYAQMHWITQASCSIWKWNVFISESSLRHFSNYFKRNKPNLIFTWSFRRCTMIIFQNTNARCVVFPMSEIQYLFVLKSNQWTGIDSIKFTTLKTSCFQFTSPRKRRKCMNLSLFGLDVEMWNDGYFFFFEIKNVILNVFRHTFCGWSLLRRLFFGIFFCFSWHIYSIRPPKNCTAIHTKTNIHWIQFRLKIW